MIFFVTKLDGRFTGAGDFHSRIHFPTIPTDKKIESFIIVRNWCWETFGPGCEVDLVRRAKRMRMELDWQWAWKRDDTQNTYSVYLTEEAYTAFILKWNE